MDNYTVVPMLEEDAAAMAAIEAQIFSRPWSADDFLESYSLPDTVYLVAKDCRNGEVLGYCGCYRSFDEGNISNVAVAPDARRRGIARTMLAELIKSGTDMGIRTFSLEVRRSNEAAKELYRGFGFETAGVRRGFYEEPKEDACIMLLHTFGQDVQE